MLWKQWRWLLTTGRAARPQHPVGLPSGHCAVIPLHGNDHHSGPQLKKFNLPKSMIFHLYNTMLRLSSAPRIAICYTAAEGQTEVYHSLCWEGDWLQSAMPQGPVPLQDPEVSRTDCDWHNPPQTQTLWDTLAGDCGPPGPTPDATRRMSYGLQLGP